MGLPGAVRCWTVSMWVKLMDARGYFREVCSQSEASTISSGKSLPGDEESSLPGLEEGDNFMEMEIDPLLFSRKEEG